jgi:ankyrin repeat protein
MKAAQLLLEYKADPNALDNSGSTPLHVAVSAGNVEIVVLLLDRGAQAQLIDKDNLTAIELIADSSTVAHKAIIIILLRHYERLSLTLPRVLKAKGNNIQPTEISAAVSNMSNLQSNSKSQAKLVAASSARSINIGETTVDGIVNNESRPPSPTRSLVDIVQSGNVFDPEKTYKALKMKAVIEARRELQLEMEKEGKHCRPPSIVSGSPLKPRNSTPVDAQFR